MDATKLQNRLIAIARRNPPGDQVPYAFEKRIMANIRLPIADAWNAWGFALWRGAGSCVIAMLLVVSWSKVASRNSDDLSQAFEKTVLAATDHFDEDFQ